MTPIDAGTSVGSGRISHIVQLDPAVLPDWDCTIWVRLNRVICSVSLVKACVIDPDHKGRITITLAVLSEVRHRAILTELLRQLKEAGFYKGDLTLPDPLCIL